MRHNTQLTEHQRYQISALMKAGHTQTDIASLIGVHKSTISRELRRNRVFEVIGPDRPSCCSGRYAETPAC